MVVYFSVDVEADGPVPGLYSMLSIGIVKVDDSLTCSRYWELQPVTDLWASDALTVSGLDREKLKTHGCSPNLFVDEMNAFILSSSDGRKPVFISDNPAFDFAFVNYYCHRFSEDANETPNPFGHKAKSIPDIWEGRNKNEGWKQLRETKHTHNALDDAMGNAEVIRAMLKLGII